MWVYEHNTREISIIDWALLSNQYPWLEELKNCPQDTEYHAEGDVFVHTRMVVEELLGLPEWQLLDEEQQSVLFIAALLHDVAKPACTKIEHGRISSPGHAKKGALMARRILYRSRKNVPPFHVREQIVQLVRHHGLPIWFWDKRNPEKTLLQASLQFPLGKVATLAHADMLGRICKDQNEMLGRIDYFKEFATEKKCLNSPYSFENNLSKFEYFNKTNNVPTYVPFDNTICEVTVMSGLPGAGKDTWVRNNCGSLPVVSLDSIRRKHKISPKSNQGKVIQMAKEEAKNYLRKKQDFVWNATNLSRSLRSALIDLLVTYKAKVKLVYVETDYQTLLSRNQSREYALPIKVLERFINRLEIPELWEAHEVHYVIV